MSSLNLGVLAKFAIDAWLPARRVRSDRVRCFVVMPAPEATTAARPKVTTAAIGAFKRQRFIGSPSTSVNSRYSD